MSRLIAFSTVASSFGSLIEEVPALRFALEDRRSGPSADGLALLTLDVPFLPTAIVPGVRFSMALVRLLRGLLLEALAEAS